MCRFLSPRSSRVRYLKSLQAAPNERRFKAQRCILIRLHCSRRLLTFAENHNYLLLIISKNFFRMFSDQSFEPTGFTSQVATEKSEKTANVQTEIVVYESKEAQKTELKTAGTQTIEDVKPKPDFDYAKLASFLKRVTPGVIEVLDEVYGSNAFEGYDPGSSGEPTAHVQLLSSLRTLGEGNTETKISDVSWSTGGGVLVVGHSATYHETWCDHLSEIKFYKLSRDDNLSETPEKILETQACITALSYHPTEPSILAAGLFNGDVLVWNLRDDDSVTPIQVCVHGDSVTSLLWRPRTLTDVTHVVTTSADGYILVHKLTANFTSVRIHKRFKVAKEHNPAENSRPRSAGGRKERAVEAGLSITCLDFSSKDPTIFVVGTLCGGLYKCSIDRAIPIDSAVNDGEDEDLKDPVIDEYKRHEGSVTSVKASPTRNVFISSGTEKEIRIYDFEQTVNLQTISVENTVIRLTWYLGGNRDIIGAYGAGSIVKFYDATDGKLLSNLQLESTRENTSCLDFNLKRDVAAVGDTFGKLEIWKIPRQAIP